MERIMKCLPTIDQVAGPIAASYALSEFLVDQVYKFWVQFLTLVLKVYSVRLGFSINNLNFKFQIMNKFDDFFLTVKKQM